MIIRLLHLSRSCGGHSGRSCCVQALTAMAPKRFRLRERRERVKRQISITQSLAQGAAAAMKAASGAAAATAAALAKAAVAASASSGKKEVKATKKAKAAASTKNATKVKKLKAAPSRPARPAVADEDSVAYPTCGSQEPAVAGEDSQETLPADSARKVPSGRASLAELCRSCGVVLAAAGCSREGRPCHGSRDQCCDAVLMLCAIG